MSKLEEMTTKRDYHANELEYLNRFIADYKELNKASVNPNKGKALGKRKSTAKLENKAKKLYKEGVSRKVIAKELGRSSVTIDSYLRGVRPPKPVQIVTPLSLEAQTSLDGLIAGLNG